MEAPFSLGLARTSCSGLRLCVFSAFSKSRRNLFQVRENESDLDKQKSLRTRQEEEVSSLHNQMDSKNKEIDTAQNELTSVRQGLVSTCTFIQKFKDLEFVVECRLVASLANPSIPERQQKKTRNGLSDCCRICAKATRRTWKPNSTKPTVSR